MSISELTPEQIEQYWRDGFVVVESLYGADEMVQWTRIPQMEQAESNVKRC